jgi:hypothetical protein
MQLCVQKYSVHFAEVYLEAVDFVSISFALYGLIVFYVLCRDELKGRRPLSKVSALLSGPRLDCETDSSSSWRSNLSSFSLSTRVSYACLCSR